jgi:hypothetical protein
MTVTPAQERALKNAGSPHGLLGPNPSFQGDLIAITQQEWSEIKDQMHPYQLPEQLEGEFVYEDDDGLKAIDANAIPYLVTHRWYLKSRKWVQEKFGPFC